MGPWGQWRGGTAQPYLPPVPCSCPLCPRWALSDPVPPVATSGATSGATCVASGANSHPAAGRGGVIFSSSSGPDRVSAGDAAAAGVPAASLGTGAMEGAGPPREGAQVATSPLLGLWRQAPPPKKPKKAVLFFEVEILDARTREKLCFLDKVPRAGWGDTQPPPPAPVVTLGEGETEARPPDDLVARRWSPMPPWPTSRASSTRPVRRDGDGDPPPRTRGGPSGGWPGTRHGDLGTLTVAGNLSRGLGDLRYKVVGTFTVAENLSQGHCGHQREGLGDACGDQGAVTGSWGPSSWGLGDPCGGWGPVTRLWGPSW